MVPPSDVLTILIQHSSVILHCAGFAKGVGTPSTNALLPLERLQEAKKNLSYEISCSTFSKSDQYIPGNRQNCTGPIGLLVLPQQLNSIPLASPCDAGTSIDPRNTGKRIFNRVTVTASDLRDSITKREPNLYNEWVVSNYSVHGILWLTTNIQFMHIGNPINYTHNDIWSGFPGESHYCVCNGEFRSLEFDDGNDQFQIKNIVDIKDIYRNP